MHDSAGNRTGDRARPGRPAPAATAATLAHGAAPGKGRARRFAAAPALLVFALALAVYANTLSNGFASDDRWIIEGNTSIRDLRNIPHLFTQDYWHGNWHSDLYRPVAMASFATTYAVGRLHPAAYHATNAILHGLCSILVLLLARRLWKGAIAAAAAGVVFALHPVHTEAVAAAFGRSEILAALGALAALLLHARDYRWGPLPPWAVRGIAVLCYVLGAFSKESAFVLPALLLLYDLALGRAPAKRLRDYAPYAAAALLMLGARWAATAGPKAPVAFADNPVIHARFGPRFLTAAAVLGRYAGLLLWPARLSVDYSFAQTEPVKSAADPAFLAGIAAITAFSTLGLLARSRSLGFASIFFLVAIAPTSNVFFPIGTIMAERLLYLPSVSIALIAGAGAQALARWRPAALRFLLPALAVLAVVAMSWRTVERNRDWQSNATLFQSAARVCPRSFRVRSVLGELAEDRGDLKTARAELERALEIWPKWSYTFWRLGMVLRKEGEIEGAQPYFRRAIEIDGKMASAHFSLGETEQQLRHYDEAIRSYRTLESLEPCYPGLHQNLGYALRDAGRLPDAEQAFRRGIACAPDTAGLYRGLATVLEEAGDTAGAEGAYRDALKRDPGDAVAANNLAWLLAEEGRPTDEALALAEQALRIDPSAIVYDTIAWIRYRRGDLRGARDAAAEAVRLDSTSAEIRDRRQMIDAAWKASNRQGGTP